MVSFLKLKAIHGNKDYLINEKTRQYHWLWANLLFTSAKIKLNGMLWLRMIVSIYMTSFFMEIFGDVRHMYSFTATLVWMHHLDFLTAVTLLIKSCCLSTRTDNLSYNLYNYPIILCYLDTLNGFIWQFTHIPTSLSDLTRYVGKHITSRWFNVQNLLRLTKINDQRVALKSFEAKAFS